MRSGRRQSMPSESIESCAAVITTDPVLVDGHTKCPPVHPLGKQTHALAVVPKQLHQIAALAP